MTPLKEVVAELSRFVFVEWFGFRSLPASPTPVYLNAAAQPVLLAPPRTTSAETGTHAFIVAPVCPLELYPTGTYDGVIGHLSYGDTVQILTRKHHWYQVECRGKTGWVRAERITPDQALVWPALQEGRVYEHDAVVTLAIRTAIKDVFALARLQLTLQDSEYCLYRLYQLSKKLDWPTERPRLPGRWHALLKDTTGTHSSVRPSPDAIMEWMKNETQGQVAYVESVGQDDTITLSTVGLTTSGEYTTHTLSHTIWREYRPVFISVN